tara:strand:+ start:3396 stop:3965 length:570 start_codon:yes stop_codon:yes gene_type:complete
LLKIKVIKILIFLILSFNFTILKADIKKNIIEKINNSETLKFEFIQISNNKDEDGVCYIKRPHFLKCEYDDKNQKELFVNNKSLVIYHKRYDKIYNYPLSKSYFSEILSKKKFGRIISEGSLIRNNDVIKVNCFIKEKGEIIFYFDIESFELIGWDLIDLNQNKITLKIINTEKNLNIEKSFFKIPKKN